MHTSPDPTEPTFKRALEQALSKRALLIEKLQSEGTNAYRLLNGVSEGLPGVTIDRYGPLILLQTFREPFAQAELLSEIEETLRRLLPYPFVFAYNHRGKSATQSFDEWHRPLPEALAELQCQEFGVSFLIRARHHGIDPWLFLDLRAGRRVLREAVKEKSVLNLFSYTCSVGISAVAAGASEVWNIDFASSSLEVGRRNAALNKIPENRFHTIEEDCLPAMRQLAGLPVGGRFSQKKKFLKLEAREFDVVVLDPPAWSKSSFGAVDVAGDYPTLFKSAILCAKPSGGRVLATNHIASVQLEDWIEVLKRCALKAGRPIRSLQVIAPEEDFPSFDRKHPLKIVLCEV